MERAGAVAQEFYSNFVVIRLHAATTDVLWPTGLPVDYPSVRTLLSDIVLIGTISANRKSLAILDVDTHGREPWEERLRLLQALWSRFSPEAREVYPVASLWNHGLLSAFDGIGEDRGLLLRLPGKRETYLCLSEKGREIKSA